MGKAQAVPPGLEHVIPHLIVKGALSRKGTSVTLTLYVEDVDKVYSQAVAAGAKPIMPPADMFWGDRYAKITDPFGHDWALATHLEDISPEEMVRRGQESMNKMQPQQ